MLYAILFGLDFYQSLYYALKTFLIVVGICAGLFAFFSPLFLGYRWKYLNAPENSYNRSLYCSEFMATEIALKLVKNVWLILLVLIALFIPRKETVYIATGLYVGESMYNSYKDTPLAKKAYNLAEMKLNELLDEKLSGAENGKTKN